jgi:hypothetical protein
MKERIRIPERTKKKIEEIETITNPLLAIKEYLDLYENYNLSEKEIPVEYDTKTGKPNKFIWEPLKKFNEGENELYSNGICVGDYSSEIFNRGLIKTLLEKTPIVIDIDDKSYLIQETYSHADLPYFNPEELEFFVTSKDRPEARKQVVGIENGRVTTNPKGKGDYELSLFSLGEGYTGYCRKWISISKVNRL